MTGDETNKCKHTKLYYGVCEDCGEIRHGSQDPVASNTGKELKPCWLCGRQPRQGTYDLSAQGMLGTVECPCNGQYYLPVEWNNAWAHKRIGELEKDFEWSKSVVEKLERRVSKQNYYVNESDKKIASLESSLEGMKKRNSELQSHITALCKDQLVQIETLEAKLKTGDDKLAEMTQQRDAYYEANESNVRLLLKKRPL